MPSSRFSHQARYQPLSAYPTDNSSNDSPPLDSPRPLQPRSACSSSQPQSTKAVSWPLMAFILTSDLIGSGVLVVPKAYAKLGWIPAQLTLALLFLLTTYTGILMVRIRKRYPHLTCYADLFHVAIGAGSRWYARLCVNILLFFVVCGSVMVQADSWNAVFPHTCNLLWIGVAAISSCLILQIRSIPNIGLVSVASVLLITIPNVIVLLDLKRYIAEGTRTPSPTALFGPSLVESFVAVLDLVFAFAGHVVFFELMLEMKDPDDFSKALWASQIVITLVYFINGTFVYNLVGPAPWLKSPLNLSMNDGIIKTFCQVLVIAHVSLAIGVDGTVFIRAVQNEFQPRLMRKLGLAPKETCNSSSERNGKEQVDLEDTCCQSDEEKVNGYSNYASEYREKREPSVSLIHSPDDWSGPAILWWLLWSVGTLLVVAFLSIAVSSFDDIIGLTASLIASQTTVSWPALFHYLKCYTPKDRTHGCRDFCAVVFDCIIIFIGVYLFATGTWANTLDIAHMYAKSPKSMFSCT